MKLQRAIRPGTIRDIISEKSLTNSPLLQIAKISPIKFMIDTFHPILVILTDGVDFIYGILSIQCDTANFKEFAPVCLTRFDAQRFDVADWSTANTTIVIQDCHITNQMNESLVAAPLHLQQFEKLRVDNYAQMLSNIYFCSTTKGE